MLRCTCGAELADTLTGGAICTRTGFRPSDCAEDRALHHPAPAYAPAYAPASAA
jgi:hypothetical protein